MRCDRCYLRGLTPLGLFNTVIGCLFNRVLVKMTDVGTDAVVGWWFSRAEDWPPALSKPKNGDKR